MRTVTISKLINLSINRTKLILFQPFHWKKWLCLLFIAALAGALGGGNGNNSKHRPAKKAQAVDYGYTVEQDESDPTSLGLYGYFKPENYPFYFEKIKSKFTFLKTFNVFILIFVFLPLAIVFIWLSTRFKFIWFDAITKNDASIAAPFKQHKDKGGSLFEFYLITLLAIIAIAIVLIMFAAGVKNGLGIIVSMFMFLAGVILLALLYTMIEHFVVTIMAIDNCLFKPAWNKFVDIYKNNQKEFWFYILILIGLGITCAIIILVATLICFLPILLAGAILFGIPYLLFKLGLVFIIYAIIVGIPFIAAALILLISIGLPFAVFFRSFSLYFLSSIDCEYNPLELE